MEVFIIITFYVCDDAYYGYNESLTCVYGTLEEAHAAVDKIVNDRGSQYDGEDKHPFLQIIKIGQRQKVGSMNNERATSRP